MGRNAEPARRCGGLAGVATNRGAPVALTIAGSDAAGGAGVQADLRAFAARGVCGASAITAVTAQTAAAVTAIHAVPPDVVAAQIDAVAAEFAIGAAKTGMLATGPIVEVVAARVEALAIRLVVDPVMTSTSGARLLHEDGADILRQRLLPLATAATPNRMEAERLAGVTITSVGGAREAARRIRDLGPAAVIVTGGHLRPASDTIVDIVDDGTGAVELETPRVGGDAGTRVHGTGCAFSAALAAGLAAGRGLVDAARDAQRYVAELIRQAQRWDPGQRPTGPPRVGPA